MLKAASIATVSVFSPRTRSSLLDNKFACIFVVWCEGTDSASLGGISTGFAGRFFLSDFPDRKIHLQSLR